MWIPLYKSLSKLVKNRWLNGLQCTVVVEIENIMCRSTGIEKYNVQIYRTENLTRTFKSRNNKKEENELNRKNSWRPESCKSDPQFRFYVKFPLWNRPERSGIRNPGPKMAKLMFEYAFSK